MYRAGTAFLAPLLTHTLRSQQNNRTEAKLPSSGCFKYFDGRIAISSTSEIIKNRGLLSFKTETTLYFNPHPSFLFLTSLTSLTSFILHYTQRSQNVNCVFDIFDFFKLKIMISLISLYLKLIFGDIIDKIEVKKST